MKEHYVDFVHYKITYREGFLPVVTVTYDEFLDKFKELHMGKNRIFLDKLTDINIFAYKRGYEDGWKDACCHGHH